jgi:hypothetical protein
LYWKLPTPVFIFICSHTNVHMYKYMGVQILHYKQDLKSIVCLVHFIFTYILTFSKIFPRKLGFSMDNFWRSFGRLRKVLEYDWVPTSRN